MHLVEHVIDEMVRMMIHTGVFSRHPARALRCTQSANSRRMDSPVGIARLGRERFAMVSVRTGQATTPGGCVDEFGVLDSLES